MILRLRKLWHHINSLRRKQLGILMILMIFASMAEVISIGAILPFLGILVAPDEVYQHHLMQSVNNILDITAPDQLLFPLTVFFIAAILLAAIVRIALLYVMNYLSFAIGSDLSINVYRRTLYQEYAVHVSRNSSEVINSIVSKTGSVIGGVIIPILSLISSTIIIIVILVALFTIDSVVASIVFLWLGVLYFGVVLYTRRKLSENSKIIATQSTYMIKFIQEGLGGIRDVLIDGSQKFYCNLYRNSELSLRRAVRKNNFIEGSPRYVMESLGMILIAAVAYTMSLREGGLISIIPILGALALGSQRLLPALQQAYSAYSRLKGVQSSFQDVLNLLEQSIPEYAKQADCHKPVRHILFKNQINLQNLSFRYTVDGSEKSPWILKDINLILAKGTRIGFIGITGSGKSTLIDIIMGLLSPTDGSLLIDGELITSDNKRLWQAHIAHVPQNIFLSDSSIEKNIAFGVAEEKIDHHQVKKAAQQAQIAGLIEGWKEGYQTFVGERGVRLSGGQRQRIGIARALYKKADVLIFDEATSALDNKTEQEVMRAIEELGKEITVLIIAHRLTTLKGCDKIVKLDKNNTTHVGSYQEMINE